MKRIGREATHYRLEQMYNPSLGSLRHSRSYSALAPTHGMNYSDWHVAPGESFAFTLLLSRQIFVLISLTSQSRTNTGLKCKRTMETFVGFLQTSQQVLPYRQSVQLIEDNIRFLPKTLASKTLLSIGVSHNFCTESLICLIGKGGRARGLE